MKLEIQSFVDAGDLDKERLILRAREDVDIGSYLIIRSKLSRTRGGPVSGDKNAYWLPDREVRAGDLIVIYTKTGTSKIKVLKTAQTAYFYYWHQEQTFWDAAKRNTAVLMLTSDWTSKEPSRVAEPDDSDR